MQYTHTSQPQVHGTARETEALSDLSSLVTGSLELKLGHPRILELALFRASGPRTSSRLWGMGSLGVAEAVWQGAVAQTGVPVLACAGCVTCYKLLPSLSLYFPNCWLLLVTVVA